MGHARALLPLPNGKQLELALQVVKKGLSVRTTESMVRRLLSTSGKRKSAPRTDPDIHRLENDLSERLGSGVRIKHTKKGKGTLQIAYNSLEQLDGIISRIK
jgi:ParB family chromosome partitioning protein